MLNRFFDFVTRFLVGWVLFLSIIGYIFPHHLLVLKRYTEWFFILTMFGIGTVLTLEDFVPIFKKPHLVLLGTLAQFTIMPLLGFIIGKTLRLPLELAVGMILVGSVPGAMASNVISYLAKADVAYSVALTSVSTFLSPVLTPTLIYIFAHSIIQIKFLWMFFSILKMVIMPLILGMILRHYLKVKIDKIVKLFPALSSLFIAFICGIVIALNRDYIGNITFLIFISVFLHNLLGLVFGYLAGLFYRFNTRQRRTLAIEIGMQNAGLGAVLALKYFSAQSALPNALFAVWCIITASILAMFWNKLALLK